jgi:hypothetical protein
MVLSNALGDNEANSTVQEDEERNAEESDSAQVRAYLSTGGCKAEHRDGERNVLLTLGRMAYGCRRL